MSDLEPEIGTDEKNIVGALDKFVENMALAILNAFSTFFILIATPWRVSHLLQEQQPGGRKGALLGAGVFFALSTVLVMVVAGLSATPEIVASNSGFIGPAYAQRVSQAVAEGEIWRVVSSIGPIYLSAIFFGLCSYLLKGMAGPKWTLNVSLRASFYQVASWVVWTIATSAVIDPIGLAYGGSVSRDLYTVNAVPVFALPIWQYFWFFKVVNSLSVIRALGSALLMTAIVFGTMFVSNLVT